MRNPEKWNQKLEMLEEMEKYNYDTETNEKSSYAKVLKDYQNMREEIEEGEEAMYPNGKDDD